VNIVTMNDIKNSLFKYLELLIVNPDLLNILIGERDSN